MSKKGYNPMNVGYQPKKGESKDSLKLPKGGSGIVSVNAKIQEKE